MYANHDLDDSLISLHDCRAEKISFDDGILSFCFSDGFWITPQHPKNISENTVRTGASSVDFHIIDNDIYGIKVQVFKQRKCDTAIHKDWEFADFIKAVNNGDFTVEFITQYKAYQSMLFKCWVWYKRKLYHSECDIELYCENAAYNWNNLRYDRKF